jgi:hypothetical protein
MRLLRCSILAAGFRALHRERRFSGIIYGRNGASSKNPMPEVGNLIPKRGALISLVLLPNAASNAVG